MAFEKLIGVVALGTLLFWVFKDAVGTTSILNSLGGANAQFVGNLQGHPVYR